MGYTKKAKGNYDGRSRRGLKAVPTNQLKIMRTNLRGNPNARNALRKVEAELKNREKDMLIERLGNKYYISPEVQALTKNTGKTARELEQDGIVEMVRFTDEPLVWRYQTKQAKQALKQKCLPGTISVRKGVRYDRVLLDGHTVASRNNLTGNMSGATDYFKYFPKN